MLIFDRENRRRHLPWFLGVCAVSFAAAGWCVWEGFSDLTSTWRWPRGSSVPGFTLGILGGAIIGFEMLLWPRKSLWRGRRLGRTKYWMAAHLWLGVMVFPLLLLHGGFHFDLTRSTLAALLMWLLLGVFMSGLFGVAIQNIVPRLMLERVPAETITGQIDAVREQQRDEARRLVELTCGDGEVESRTLVVERVRRVGAVEGKVAEAIGRPRRLADTAPLREFFDSRIDPFLATSVISDQDLSNPKRAADLFTALKLRLSADAHDVVDRLADFCDQRRQFEAQRRLQRWLQTWLSIHVALSVGLFVLMIAHVVLAMRFV